MYPTLEQLTEGEVLLINKPLTWTSFDVIGKLRYHTHVKMGHAGTLDPLATGLLVICTGKATKKITNFVGLPKTYEGTFTLGATTPTYDLESDPENQLPFEHLTEDEIKNACLPFIGHIKQMPPMHSAIKKGGKKLYDYARQGIEIKVDPRDVHISTFEITKIELPIVHFKVDCGSGTYIRSLAHDFGEVLKTGGYLSSLVRTKVGDFELEKSFSLPEMVAYYKERDPKVR